MSLVTTTEIQQSIPSDLPEWRLQQLIDDEEAELIRRFGAHGDGVAAETHEYLPRAATIWLRRPFISISSVTEYQTLDSTTGTLLAATAYRLVAGQGALIRLPHGTHWGARVSVTGVPIDDRGMRRGIIIDLVRLRIERTAMTQESVAGEYSYTAPAWAAERESVLRRAKLGYVM